MGFLASPGGYIAGGGPVKLLGHAYVPLLLQKGPADAKPLAHRSFLSFH